MKSVNRNKKLEYGALADYWRAATAALPVLLIISFAAAVLAYGLISQQDPNYQAHFSYLVSLSEREPAGEYRFDGYYALQATDLFAATLARWIQTPETIISAYRAALLTPPSVKPRDLTSFIRAEKTAPQLVQVTVTGKNEEDVLALTVGLQQVMAGNVESYHKQGIPAVTFRVVSTQPWVGINKLSAPVIVSAVFAFTFFMSINVQLLILAAKKDIHH